MPIRMTLLAAVAFPSLAFAQAAAPVAPPAAPPAAAAPARPPVDPAKAAEAISKAPALFFQLVAPGRRVDAMERTMQSVLSQIDVDHNGVIDAADAKTMDDMQAIRTRVGKVGRILAYDIHNNGKVTRAEVEAGVRRETPPGQPAQAVQARIDAIMRADLNHDGVIDFEEMRTLSPDEAHPPVKNPVEQVLALSPDGRSITVKEVEDKFAEFLQAVDTDGDGTVSEAEFKAIQGPRQAAEMAARTGPAPAAVPPRMPPLAKPAPASAAQPRPAAK